MLAKSSRATQLAYVSKPIFVAVDAAPPSTLPLSAPSRHAGAGGKCHAAPNAARSATIVVRVVARNAPPFASTTLVAQRAAHRALLASIAAVVAANRVTTAFAACASISSKRGSPTVDSV